MTGEAAGRRLSLCLFWALSPLGVVSSRRRRVVFALRVREREEFLAGVHIGVLSAAAGTAGRTLAIPVWYSYQPGGLLTVLTGRWSRKAAAPAGSACASRMSARPTVMSASRGRS